jgi:formiminotetrahydrofolate cyclodeaminase
LGTHSTSALDADVGPLLPLTIILSVNALNHSESDSILDLSVRELLERLGSSAPAPGGGAAAALAGALGAGLVQMTANLSIGRPKLVAIEPHARDIEAQAAALRVRLAELGDADAQAYARVSAAYKLPRPAAHAHAQDPEREQAAQDNERSMSAQDSERQRSAQDPERVRAIQRALRQAAEVPLQTAQLCAALLELADRAAPLLNPLVISDVMVGALLAQAALESAALNVDVNLRAMTDAEAVAHLQRDLDAAQAGSTWRLQRVLDTARARLSKPVSKR